jgi:predicted porin
LSLCSGAWGTNVTLYGVGDAGVVYNNGSSEGATVRLDSGIESGSRLGVKGVEDLSNGMRALFVLEQGFGLDSGASTQGGRVFGRQAWVGLDSNFGTVTLGRQYTPIYNAYGIIDPFGNNTAGDINTLFGQDDEFLSRDFRMDNTITYKTPAHLGGFNASLAYGFGEQAGNSAMQRQMGVSMGYVNGPVTAIYAYHQANNENLEFDADTGDVALIDLGTFHSHFLGAVYDARAWKLHAAWDQTAQGDHFKTQSYLIGATLPIGKDSLFGDVIYRDNKEVDHANATQLAIGYNFTLSKRTNLYSIFAHTKNDRNSMASTDIAGKSVTRVQVGMRHIF